jgi:glycosyltransferase involved in cell wall biosynthesis
MNPGLISIVLPVKNEEKFLEECLESIVNQSEQNWELIICDDHSTDSTSHIINSFSSKDDRIKGILNGGEGIIPALNTAYNLTVGEYITRMDGDDIMPKNKLKELKSLLIQNGRGYLATGMVKYFPEEEIADGFLSYEKWLNGLCSTQNHWEDVYKECVIPSPCWMVGREDFEACGGFKPAVYPEDYDLTFRFYGQELKVLGSDKVLHLWRDHMERTSRNSEHYQTQTFFGLKLDYLFKLEPIEDKNVVIWGAGKKGKVLARHLIERGKSFRWVCNNKKKVGKEIEGVEVEYFTSIPMVQNSLTIVTVSGHEDRSDIIEYLETNSLIQNEDYFLFC